MKTYFMIQLVKQIGKYCLNIYNLKTKFIVSFLLILSLHSIAQQNTIDDKTVFLAYVSHFQYDENTFKKYIQLFKQNEYNLYKNDEFQYPKFYEKTKTEYLNGIANLNYHTTYVRSKYVDLGAYNFTAQSFPLNMAFENVLNEDRNDFFGNLYDLNPYPWSLPGIRADIFNQRKLDLALKMQEAKANLFIQNRKTANGQVNRKVLCKAEYSLMTKPISFFELSIYHLARLTIYIHKIQIYDGNTLLNTIYPSEDYYDKINGYKLKFGADKTFYNSNWYELNKEDSLQASYYRITNYENGRIVNPVIDYYMSGAKQMEGEFSNYWGTKNGQSTWYYENGQIYKQATYQNNMLNGKMLAWYSNGDKQEEVNYINDKKDGCDYMWDESGKCLVKSILGDWTYSSSYFYFFDYYENGARVDKSKVCPCVKRTDQNATLQENQSPNTNNTQENSINNKTSFIGYYNQKYSEGEYKFVDGGIYYKSNNAEIKSAFFKGANRVSKENDLRVRGNTILSTNIFINGFKSVGDKYYFTYSVATTFENGELFEKRENKQDYSYIHPQCDFGFDYGTPSLKNGASSKILYTNFVIKDKYSDAVIQGFYKFILIQ